MSTVQGRILIADDDREMAQLLGHLFHREGLTPLLARDGEEAMQLVRGGDPDVLLAGLRMPGMDGMEVMRLGQEPGSARDPRRSRCRTCGSREWTGWS